MSDLADFQLSARARKLIASVVPWVAPPGEAARLGVIDAVVAEAELMIRSLPAGVRLALVAGMTTYDLAAAALPRHRGRRAADLGDDAAHAWFEAWRHGNAIQRNFIKGIKGIIGIAYYEQRAVQAALGYGPHAYIEQVGKRRLAVYRDDIDAHEASVFAPDPIPLPSEIAARRGGGRATHLPTKKEAS